VFEPETTELRLQWTPKLAELLAELRKSPAVLRLSYLADVEPEKLVRERLAALKQEIARQWQRSGGELSPDHRNRSLLAQGRAA
jgi:large repetitive protein